MGVVYKYINQNSFPVVVPGKGGASTTFDTGEGSTDPWFSRFCGARSLSRVAIATPDASPGQVVQAPVAAELPMRESIIAAITETTPNWIKRNGIYYCKHCELFRTGSRLAMTNHITQYHQLEIEPLVSHMVPPPVAPVSLASVTPTQPTEVAVPSVTLSVTPVQPAAEAPAQPETLTTEAPVFICKTCGRMYRTETGLQKHMRTVHTESKIA